MEDYYCPRCLDKLERLSGCGAVGYMCNTCRNLISRKKVLTRQEMEEAKRRQKGMPSTSATSREPSRNG